MYIETKRLIIRDLIEQDAGAIFEMKNDEQIRKYAFLKGDETFEFIKVMIKFFQYVKNKGLIIDDQHPERGCLYAICLKEENRTIGVITVNPMELFSEVHMGWFILSPYTKKGYASEAGEAISNALLEALSLDYISATPRIDNIASFRTAQKSGFTLIEKRVPYIKQSNTGDIIEVSHAFEGNQVGLGAYYYFQKRKRAPF